MQVLFTAGVAEALLEEIVFWIKEHASSVPPMWGDRALPPAAPDGAADGKPLAAGANGTA